MTTEPGDGREANGGTAPAPKRARTRWLVAIGIGLVIVLMLLGVRVWRGMKERQALLKEQAELQQQLKQVKREIEQAKAEEERLKRELKRARDAAKSKRSPPYFDSPGWRNDTGKPSSGRVRPLPVDPSRRKPDEQDLVP